MKLCSKKEGAYDFYYMTRKLVWVLHNLRIKNNIIEDIFNYIDALKPVDRMILKEFKYYYHTHKILHNEELGKWKH